MPSPNKIPLEVSLPVNLNGKLIQDIANRVETIAPIEETSGESPIHVRVGEGGGLGTKIKANMVAYEVQVCMDGVARTMFLYGKPE